MAKAIQVVTRAVEEDEKKNYKDAYYLYCEGLQYFVPLIAAETDSSKRIHLQQKAITYMERAEEIKRSYVQQEQQQQEQQECLEQQSSQSECAATSHTQQRKSPSTVNAVQQALTPTSSYKQLCKWFSRQKRLVLFFC